MNLYTNTRMKEWLVLITRTPSGFSIIELMIIMAVVAILASLAFPSYREYVLRTNRSEAINDLVDIAACQERIYLSENRYDPTLNRCVRESRATLNGHYMLSIEVSADRRAYSISAMPAGAQTDDSCGSMILNHLGERAASKAESDTEITKCWRGRKI